MAEYRRRRAQDASSIDGSMGEPSPRSFHVATEKGSKHLMTEDEVSTLVHSALMRARQATSSFSPRARSARSPISSPGSVSSPVRGSGRRPPYSSSPRKASTALNVPRDEEFSGRPTLSTRSRRTAYATPQSRATEGSAFSFEGYSTPDNQSHNGMENVEVDINGLSMMSTDTGDELMSNEGDLGRSIASVNSSEAIIRRVEEEIANARKAALLACEKTGLEAPANLIKDPQSRPDRLLTDIRQITSVVPS